MLLLVFNTDVTSSFDMLQIKGTASTPAGQGTFVNYKASAAPAFLHDTFIIVNKSYRLFTTENNENGVNDFTVTIKVSDDSLPAPQPIKTFTLIPNYNDTRLENVFTVHVGGESTPAGVSWGQNTLPILNYVEDAGNPPDGIVVEYGTTGVLMKLYGMNGANRGNPLASPSQNQTGLIWSIESQEQPLGTAVNIFQIDAVTGEVTEINEGDGLGLYHLRIIVSSGDGSQQPLNINITIGRPTANGSFSNNIRDYELNYDNSYLFNLHGTAGNAYNNIGSGAAGLIDTSFKYTFPDIGAIPLPGLNEFYTNTTNGGYAYGAGNFQKLNVVQPTGNTPSPFEGALTQGTGYINIEMYLQGLSSGANNDYQTSQVSWAVEYREIIGGVVQPWKAATDIEGNILSWNSALTGSTLTNPQQSGEKVNGEGSGPQPGGISTATHSARNSQALGLNTRQKYGAADFQSSGVSINDPQANSVMYRAEKQYSSGIVPEIYIGKWVAVGNSPVYGTPACFGEYRIIVQNIGGQCPTCQSMISGNTERVSDYAEAGVINIGDFYYDLRPVGSSRAFAYEVDVDVFPDNATGLQDALNNEMNSTIQLFAEEGVNRYVSQFYVDSGLTIPYTSWTGVSPNGYISYRPWEVGTSDYNVPYSINVPDLSNPPSLEDAITPVLVCETSASEGGIYSTDQNKRLWACRINTTTGLKHAGTSVGKSGE